TVRRRFYQPRNTCQSGTAHESGATMSQHRRAPHIEARTLRDNASGPRVERIWNRLEANLVPARKAPKRSLSIAWVPALATGLALGFLVGRESAVPEPLPPGQLIAEPATPEPA